MKKKKKPNQGYNRKYAEDGAQWGANRKENGWMGSRKNDSMNE